MYCTACAHCRLMHQTVLMLVSRKSAACVYLWDAVFSCLSQILHINTHTRQSNVHCSELCTHPPLLSKSERLLAGTRGSMDVSSFPSFPFPTSGNTCLEKGLHGSQTKPPANLQSNETGKHTFVSNTRGTAAIAHWDVPDCGNTEFFINLKANSHLDEAYGGYCVFVSHPGTCISLCVCACVHTDNTSTHTCTHTHMEVLELRVNDNATCLG